jgi:mRNA interferase HigB
LLLPKRERSIISAVRIIARSTLNRFVNNRVDSRVRTSVKKHLDAWYAEAEKASWKDPGELKVQFRSASIVSRERVVFNIKGNDYRLVVAINYRYQILLILWLGSHEEYDKIDVTKVAYEKERYADSSNSN